VQAAVADGCLLTLSCLISYWLAARASWRSQLFPGCGDRRARGTRVAHLI